MKTFYFAFIAWALLPLNFSFALTETSSQLEQKALLGDVNAQLNIGLSYFDAKNYPKAFY